MYFLLPVKRSWKEDWFHRMFCGLSRLYIFLVFPERRVYNSWNEDFTKPSVIISNHQSLIETPAMLRLHPKIIILTTTWVYNSPVFGPVARLASFYNVDQGLDPVMERLKEKVSQGYSLLVFPEAHRSAGDKIQRFHKGAFYLAEQLKLDILPLMMFGSGDFLDFGSPRDVADANGLVADLDPLDGRLGLQVGRLCHGLPGQMALGLLPPGPRL